MGHVVPAAATQFLPDSADQVRTARVRGALPAHQVGPRITWNRARDPGYLECAEVGFCHEGRRLAVPRLRDLFRRLGRGVLVSVEGPDGDYRAFEIAGISC